MKFQLVTRFLLCSAFAASLSQPLPALADDSPAKGDTSATTSASSSPAAGWQSYSGGSCTIQYPNGWQVGGDPKNGRIDFNNANGVRLSVLPFSTSEEITSSKSEKFFTAMVHYCSPNQPWSKPQRFGENAFRSTYSNDTETAIIAMVFSPSGQGTVGRIAVARVPKGATFPTDTFAQIMSSQHYTAPGGAQQAMMQQNPQGMQQPGMQNTMLQQRAMQGMQSPGMMQPGMVQGGALGLPPTPFVGWTQFRDPQEGSFSVDVPIGWKVEGGLTRGSAIDARPWVKVTSPDQLISAFIGDGKIPPFSIPTAQGAFLGYGVGASYGGGKVEPYMPARKFVEYYAKSNLKKYISDITVVEANNHPDIAAAINGTVGCSRSEAATIKFTGMYKTIPAVGYYLAVTKETLGYGAGMWWVTQVAGVLSPADRDKASLNVIVHMFQTFHLDPQWQGQSLKTTKQVSTDYTRASQAMSQGIVDRYWSQQAANEATNNAYWNRQAVQDHAADNFSDYIRGQQNVQDPDTGTQYKVQYGPQGHYIDPSGNVMGSNYGAPGPEWRQLMAVP
jgi:hypothetical protein